MNSLTIAGRIGKDPEQRVLQDGTSVLSFSVADDQGKDKPAIWWRCSLFGKRADALAPYLTKGSPVTVVGTVTEREYTDKDGQQRKSMDVRVQEVALQGSKSDAAPRSAPSQPQAAPKRPTGASGFDDMDDDVPF